MAWVERRGEDLLIGWRDPHTGKKVRRSLEVLVAQVASLERARATRDDVPAGPYILSALTRAQDLRESTRYGYIHGVAKHALPLIGETPVHDVGPNDVREVLDAMERSGVGPSYRRLVRRALSMAFRQAVDEGLANDNPVSRVPEPAPERPELKPLDIEVVEALADAITPRFRAAVLLAAYSGLRIGEVGALRPESIDLGRATLRVTRSVAAAGGKTWVGDVKTESGRRSVPVGPWLLEAVSRHLKVFGLGPTGYVFSTTQGGLLHKGSIHKPFKRARESLGLLDVRFHHLRHTYAALLIREGAPAKLIQSLMGHSSIAITMNTYGHLFPGMGEEYLARLSLRRSRALMRASRPIGAELSKSGSLAQRTS